jgi:xylonate dehydratase
MAKTPRKSERRLRSQLWFDNPDNPGMTALYIERYLNWGLTRKELHSSFHATQFRKPANDPQPHSIAISHIFHSSRCFTAIR